MLMWQTNNREYPRIIIHNNAVSLYRHRLQTNVQQNLGYLCIFVSVVLTFIITLLVVAMVRPYWVFVVLVSSIGAFGMLLACTFLLRRHYRHLKLKNRTPGFNLKTRGPTLLLRQSSTENQAQISSTLPQPVISSQRIVVVADPDEDKTRNLDLNNFMNSNDLPKYNEVIRDDNLKCQTESPPPSYKDALKIII